jgi:hypothetical protein
VAESFLDYVEPGGAHRAESNSLVHAHLANCSSCSQQWQRLLDQSRCLAALTRMQAPVDLEGRVVAALNAGYREDRVVEAIKHLPRHRVPEILDGGFSTDDQLAGRLGFPLAGLERHRAPDELRRRLELQFAPQASASHSPALGTAEGPKRGFMPAALSQGETRWLVASLLSVAAAVVMLTTAPPAIAPGPMKQFAGADAQNTQPTHNTQNTVMGAAENSGSAYASSANPRVARAKKTYPFTVRRVTSLHEVSDDPIITGLIEAASGGAFSSG